jgi:Tol biopolymer transport system component
LDPGTGNLDASTRGENEDRLDSWKRIAVYLKRDVSTVQRWERRESMPVHRHLHDKQGSVFAFRSELDAWWQGRRDDLAGDERAAPDEAAQPAGGETGAVGATRLRARRAGLLALMLALPALAAIGWYAVQSDLLWRSPLADAKFTPVTDFSGDHEAAAISRDGKHLAFIAERDGKVDAWLSAINSGSYRNLTNGDAGELINPATRTLGFSADSQSVFVWTRHSEGSRPAEVSILSAPVSGGSLRPYLAGAAELDSSHDGKRIVYHTTAPGDPMFVRDLSAPPGTVDHRIYAAPDGVHCHFPIWSPDDAYIYFVRGVPPDEWDIWRVRASGADLERITAHNSRVAYPVLLDARTLLYLADDAQRDGPWLYAMDVVHRVPHQISLGVETYTSLAASADGLHLAATVANRRTSIWRMKLDTDASAAAAVPELVSPNGSSARFAGHGIVYVAESANGQRLWKSEAHSRSEIWNAAPGRIAGAPAVSADRRRIAVPVEEAGRSKLYVMDADGSHARVVADSLELRGNPDWAPDGRSIVISALHDGKPNLTRVFLDGAAPTSLTSEYSIDPAWSPDGQFVLYTGSDVGTTFPLRAAAADGHPYPLPGIMLSRGARRISFLPSSQALAILTGGIGHKNLSLLDLQTGAQRTLAELPPGFNIRDFDISADGSELMFERVEGNSFAALIER